MNGKGGRHNEPEDYSDELATFAERAREVVDDLNALVADLRAFVEERDGQ